MAAALMAMTAVAQQNVLVKYDVSNRDNDSGTKISKPMVLIASPTESLYFNEMSQYVDSCMSTPEGAAKLHEVQMKAWRVVYPDGTVTYDGRKLGLAPEKQVYLYVEKDREKDQCRVYDYKAGSMWRYEEPMSDISWSIIEDSVKNVLGHECLMACADYHGRTWTAWFAPDIPVQDGPWKLRGLPGLILQAAGGDDFEIIAEEVGITHAPVPEVYSKNDYEQGRRKQILADHEYYIDNLESIMNAQGIKMNADGTPGDLPKYDRRRSAWELDY